ASPATVVTSGRLRGTRQRVMNRKGTTADRTRGLPGTKAAGDVRRRQPRDNDGMQLEISPEERELLTRLVEGALGHMPVHGRRTSTPAYRARLAAEERELAGLLGRLRGLAHP